MSPATMPAAWRRHAWLIAGVFVIIAAVLAFVWGPWRDSGFVEHRMLQRTDIPAAIAIAPDGAVWFTIEMSDAIGVHRHGRIERLSKRTQNLETLGLDVDAGGGVWYTDGPARAIARLAADGSIRSFPLTTPIVRLGRLAVGPDGAVWFADATTASVTRLKDGVFTRHVSRSAGAAPWGVAVEPAGTVWATLPSVNRLARIMADGQVTEFDVPTRGSGLGDVAVDGRGAVWFLEQQANKIGRFADGRFTEFAIPTPSPGLTALAGGARWRRVVHAAPQRTAGPAARRPRDGISPAAARRAPVRRRRGPRQQRLVHRSRRVARHVARRPGEVSIG